MSSERVGQPRLMQGGGAHTERRLDGHKLFVTYNKDGQVVIQAVTDSRPVTRLVFQIFPDEAREIATDLLDAVRLVLGRSDDG